MNEKELIEAIDDYLNDDRRYAVLVDGKWGCGKTYFMGGKLREHIKSRKYDSSGNASGRFEMIHVSLFGLSNADELMERIFTTWVRGKVSLEQGEVDSGKDVEASGDKLRTSGGGPFKMLSDVVTKKLGLEMSLTASLAASAIAWSSKVLVLDDVERRIAKDGDERLIGTINDLVENSGAKAILVCNYQKRPVSHEILEKVVWKRFSFEPDIDALSHSVFEQYCDKYPAELCALEAVCSSAKSASCQNVRAMIRATQVVEAVGETAFVQDAKFDAIQRRSVLSDVFMFALKESMGDMGDPKPVSGTTSYRSNELSKDIDALIDPETERLRQEWERYCTLPFIAHIHQSGHVDRGEIESQLDRYARTYYPDSSVRKAALEAESTVRTQLFEDDVANAALAALLEAFDDDDLAVSSLGRMLSAVERLEYYGIASGKDCERALEGAKRIANAHPVEAKKLLEEPFPIVYQQPIFDYQHEPELVDRLLDHINGIIIRDDEALSVIDTAVRERRANAARLVADVLRETFEATGVWMDDRIPSPELTCEAVVNSDVESINALRVGLYACKQWFTSHNDQVARIHGWLVDLASELEARQVSSKMRTLEKNLLAHQAREYANGLNRFL